MLFLNNLSFFQLDAIPTIGFSDPIFSYLSSLQFYFNCIPKLREGYEKVILLTPYVLPTYRTDNAPLDKTRSIQNLQISEVDGVGKRI